MLRFRPSPLPTGSVCGLALALFCIGIVPAVGLAVAAEPSIASGAAQGDTACDFWIVNTRCAPKTSGVSTGFDAIRFERCEPNTHRVTRETLASFLQAQAGSPTLVFIHGNMRPYQDALNACRQVHRRMQQCGQKMMLVLWSWPSEVVTTRPLLRPIKRIRDDLRLKYRYSEYQGYYLAQIVRHMDPSQPLTLTGHSFGGIISVSALHLLGRGHLNGLSLPEIQAPPRTGPLNCVLIAGAFDHDTLYPGRSYGQALSVTTQLMLTYNPTDSTLKRWPRQSSRGQRAIGAVGIDAGRLSHWPVRIVQFPTCGEVGRSHYIEQHLASDRLFHTICNLACNR